MCISYALYPWRLYPKGHRLTSGKGSDGYLAFTSICYKIFGKLIFLKWGHGAHSPWQAFCILLICDLYLQSNDFFHSAAKEFWVINELMAASTQGRNNSLRSEKFNHSTDCFVYKTTKQPSMIDFLFAELIAIFLATLLN